MVHKQEARISIPKDNITRHDTIVSSHSDEDKVINKKNGSFNESLKIQSQMNEKEEKKAVKDQEMSNENRNIESLFHQDRRNSFDSRPKVNVEGKNPSIMILIISFHFSKTTLKFYKF